MEIKDLLSKDLMIMNLQSTTKKDVIDEMIEKLYENNIINDVLKFRSEIMKESWNLRQDLAKVLLCLMRKHLQ